MVLTQTAQGSWLATWWAKGLTIIIGTFILEDATTILAAMACEDGKLERPIALISLYIGVAFGDVLLYGLGALGAKWTPFQRWITLPKHDRGHEWFSRHVVKTVIVSRFIPGARLPLYTACGFFRAPLGRFALSAVGATLVWTSILFTVSEHVGNWMEAHLQGWRWVGMAGFVITIIFVSRLIARLQSFSD
ncbi:DedA family protein [Brytella acorum]|uniref:DedA family protein n=1 Tax=Brytella acorum TaxID=2959299 RepID=A0AA35Y2X1_9PROT|nr:DedA family protein [Brytella acorum]MDF3624475.1 DedA family protein [Brytella acorum]CAI9119675.1 DedA family protein [Brytella acorum]